MVRGALAVKQPPDWDRYSDRELQEAIATNAFMTAAVLGRIAAILAVIAGAVIACAAKLLW